MRTVLLSDVSAAARVLLGVPKFQRARLCARMLREADHADRYLRKQGKLHPKWGNGTLLAVARTRPLSSEPSFDDVDYCSCFELVLRGLRYHLRAANL
jgi:hypothetical protein